MRQKLVRGLRDRIRERLRRNHVAWELARESVASEQPVGGVRERFTRTINAACVRRNETVLAADGGHRRCGGGSGRHDTAGQKRATRELPHSRTSVVP